MIYRNSVEFIMFELFTEITAKETDKPKFSRFIGAYSKSIVNVIRQLASSIAVIGISAFIAPSSQAQNLQGLFGALLNQAIQQPRPYIPPPMPQYAPPTQYQPPPVPQAQYYQEPEPTHQKRITITATVRTKADKDEFAELKNQLELSQVLPDGSQDITVLIVSHDTSRVARNLAGDPQFIGPAAGCYPFGLMKLDPSTPDGRFFMDVVDKIRKKGGAGLSMDKCTSKNFAQFDVLVFSAGQLDLDANPGLKLDDVRPIVSAIKEGFFIKFAFYSRDTFEAEVQARKDAITADEQRRTAEKAAARVDFDNRDDGVVSALYMKLPPGVTCVSVSAEGADALLRPDSPFTELGTRANQFRAMNDLNTIFLAIKKHECFAVIAPTGLLRDLIKALNRDNVAFDYDPHAFPEVHAATPPSTLSR
jgi:hypothetical protein